MVHPLPEIQRVCFLFSCGALMNTQDVFLYFRACRFEAQTAATPPPAHRPPAAPCPEALCLMLTACPQPRPLPGGLAVPPFHSLLCLEVMLWVFHDEHPPVPRVRGASLSLQGRAPVLSGNSLVKISRGCADGGSEAGLRRKRGLGDSWGVSSMPVPCARLPLPGLLDP